MSDKDEPKAGAGKSAEPAWPAVDSDAAHVSPGADEPVGSSATAAESTHSNDRGSANGEPSTSATPKVAKRQSEPAWPDVEPDAPEQQDVAERAPVEAARTGSRDVDRAATDSHRVVTGSVQDGATESPGARQEEASAARSADEQRSDAESQSHQGESTSTSARPDQRPTPERRDERATDTQADSRANDEEAAGFGVPGSGAELTEPRPGESAKPAGRRHQLREDDEPQQAQSTDQFPVAPQRPGAPVASEWSAAAPRPPRDERGDQPTMALPRATQRPPRPGPPPTSAPNPGQGRQPGAGPPTPYPQDDSRARYGGQDRREQDQHTQVLPVINEPDTDADADTDRGTPVPAAYTASSPLDAPTERRMPADPNDTLRDDRDAPDAQDDHGDYEDEHADDREPADENGEGSDEERAHPMRISPEDDDEERPKPRKRRKRKGLLLSAGALGVVVLLAIGALIGVPGLADKLGVPLPAAVRPTDAPPTPVAAQRKVTPLADSAPRTTPEGVSAALAQVTKNPKLATLTGTVIDPRTGATMWNKTPTTPLAPGSTQKLLTAAAALLTIDPTTTYQTKVVQGARPDTAVLVGGGDPTINSLPVGKDSVYWNSAHLSDLVDQVRKASGGKIKSVTIDQSRYSGPTTAPGWDKRDIKGGDWSPIVPAMLDGGRQDPTKAEGSPRSSNAGGDLLGKLAAGIGATPGGAGKAPAGGKVLGQISSAPVSDLVANMLTESDNVLTETMGREVAIANGGQPTFEGATKSVLKVLRDKGFDTAGASMSDLSGLSTNDKVPASLIQSVLRTAAAPDDSDPRTAKLAPILDGLPVAGGTGTLAAGGRYQKGPSAPGKGFVRAKTGTLNNVNALAGLVQDVDGRVLTFVFMSNGSSADQARPALDAIAAKLRGCGCR